MYQTEQQRIESPPHPEGDRKAHKRQTEQQRIESPPHPEGDRKGPHTTPHHARPYKDTERLRQECDLHQLHHL